jgi:hypothetical protein
MNTFIRHQPPPQRPIGDNRAEADAAHEQLDGVRREPAEDEGATVRGDGVALA